MSFGAEFVTLFGGMSWIVAACLIVGLILVAIEMFQPGIGVFGILGGIFLVAGIAIRLAKGDGNPLAQLVIMLFFIVVILGAVFIVAVTTLKKGWLSKTPLVENGTAVAVGHSDGTSDFSALVGKSGKALTSLRPAGKAEIDGVSYDVVAKDFFIDSGEDVLVESTEGVKISVKRAD